MSVSNLVWVLLISTSLQTYAQTRVHIEPNAVVSIDTTKFRMKNVFGHEWGQTVGLEQAIKVDSVFSFYISTSDNFIVPDPQKLDSLIDASIGKIKNAKHDSIEVLAAYKLHLKDYAGMVMVCKSKSQLIGYYSTIYMQRFSKDGMMDVFTTRTLPQNEIMDLKAHTHVEAVRHLLDSIRVYSQNELDSFRTAAVSFYQISVVQLPVEYQWYTEEGGKKVSHVTYNRDSVPADLMVLREKYPGSFNHKTFRGKLVIEPRVMHRIKEVRVPIESGGYQLFTPEPDGEIIFTSTDSMKGRLKKECYIVFILGNGIPVTVPFMLVYENK
jgi:hypothetical protein